MKGVEPIIAAVLIIAISVAGIAIVLEYGRNSVSRLNEMSLYNEAKGVLDQTEDAINSVASEGEGSTRVLRLSISGGEYVVSSASDAITFTMESKSQLVGNGVTKNEDELEITGQRQTVVMKASYPELDIISDYSFGAGHRTIVVRNEGYDQASGKQSISVSE
jgi:hypothetical protein